MSEENTTQTEEKKVDPQEKRSRDTGAKDLNHLELSVEGNRTEFRTAKYLANSNKHGEKPLLPGHSTDEGDFGMYVNSTKLGGRDPEKAFEEHKGALVTDLSQQLGCSEEDIELKDFSYEPRSSKSNDKLLAESKLDLADRLYKTAMIAADRANKRKPKVINAMDEALEKVSEASAKVLEEVFKEPRAQIEKETKEANAKMLEAQETYKQSVAKAKTTPDGLIDLIGVKGKVYVKGQPAQSL